jgi:enoyl-CoA hydratase
LANTKAKFAITDVKLGFLPGAGAIHQLPKLIGKGKEKEMILTGDPIDANKAHRVGLVNHVTEPNELMNLAQTFAEKFMTRAPLALRLGKVSVDVGFESGVTIGSHFENIAQALLCSTEDKAEESMRFLKNGLPNLKESNGLIT